MSRPERKVQRGQVVRPTGQAPWVMREPHVLFIAGDVDGETAPGEFSVAVPGEGPVTVVPGRDADWDAILVELRVLGRIRKRRVLYNGEAVVQAVGDYPDGARLQWGRP